MIAVITKPNSGGASLLKKYGPQHFSKLAKKGVAKRREAMRLWEEQEAKKTKKG